jgi:HK97 family phage prohead protease
MERRILTTHPVRMIGEGDEARISGYGAVFYDGTPGTEYRLREDMVERLLPGAFDRAIREDDVRGLFNHDPNNVLGRSQAGTMKLAADGTGLRYEIVPGETTIGRDVREHLKRGDVTGSSFSFELEKNGQEFRKENGLIIREIKSVRLFDVGPVTFPAYTGTTAEARAAYEKFEQDGADLARRLFAYEARARIACLGL